jgi:hypothetical protein
LIIKDLSEPASHLINRLAFNSRLDESELTKRNLLQKCESETSSLTKYWRSIISLTLRGISIINSRSSKLPSADLKHPSTDVRSISS